MSDFLKIEFNQNDLLRIRRALDRLDAIVTVQKDQFPYNCAVDYKNLVIQNILTQKYSSSYAPYSPRYAKWKTQTMLMGSHFWRLYGDLLRSISNFRVQDGWMGGVPEGVMDSGGKSWFGTSKNRRGVQKPIAMYGKVMEQGLHTHLARPVFGPSAQEYIRSGYQVRVRESFERMRLGWR